MAALSPNNAPKVSKEPLTQSNMYSPQVAKNVETIAQSQKMQASPLPSRVVGIKTSESGNENNLKNAAGHFSI